MKYPLVTIGIPTFNRADKYLRDTLRSALNQTYSNIEIIVSDNCSQDDTETLVKSFSDSNLKYFKQEVNIGPSNNFNFCLNKANGDYFLLLHDDDLIDNDFVEICLIAANYESNYGFIRSGTRVINSEGKTLQEYPNNVVGLPLEEFFRGWFAYKTSWYLCSTLFNTKKLIGIGGLQSKHQLLQDCVAIVKLAAKYKRVDVRDVKSSFRKHENEITFAVSVKDWCEDFLSLLELMCSCVSTKNDIIRAEGERFFAKLNYNRAETVNSALNRLVANFIVFRKFHYKFLPPPLRHIIYRNPISLYIRGKSR